MKFQLQVQPLPFPTALNDLGNLKLILGLALILVGALVFSMWKEKFYSLKEEERMKFLMFNVKGGGWLLAVFATCGGLYFMFDSVFKFTI
jgi:hypothetical protein